MQLADRAARRIVWLLYAITAVYAIDVALTEISRVFFVPLAVSVVQSFVASMTSPPLLIGLLLTPFAAAPAVPPSAPSPRWLKLPLWSSRSASSPRRSWATWRWRASSPSSWS